MWAVTMVLMVVSAYDEPRRYISATTSAGENVAEPMLDRWPAGPGVVGVVMARATDHANGNEIGEQMEAEARERPEARTGSGALATRMGDVATGADLESVLGLPVTGSLDELGRKLSMAVPESQGLRQFQRLSTLGHTLAGFDNLREALVRTATKASLSNLRLGDAFTPGLLRGLQSSAHVAHWEQRLPELLAPLHEQLEQVTAAAASVTRLTGSIADIDPGRGILGPATARAVRAWRDYLPDVPDPYELRFSGVSGLGVAALVAGDAAADGEIDDLVADAERAGATPWLAGIVGARKALCNRLGELDGRVPELLDGAWEEVGRPGSAAVTKIAHCIVEALDRALRAAAPERDTLAWHAANNRAASELSHGRPTRALRVRFLLSRRPAESRLAAAEIAALEAQVRVLVPRLQAAKHAPDTQLAAVRCHLVCVESVLTQIFAID